MFGQLIEYYIEKIFLEKFGPWSTVVYDISMEIIWKFRIPPIYKCAIINP